MSLLNKASLIQIPSGYKDGTLYSAKPTNGDGDFTFSRGSNLAATRVNSDGLIEKGRENLLLQSNQFDTTWSLADGATITSGQSGYDGSNDAWKLTSGAGSFSRIEQTLSQSGVQTFSVYAKAGEVDHLRVLVISSSNPDFRFNLTNGTIAYETGNDRIEGNITEVGNGWYRCSVTCNASGTSYRFYPMQDSTTFASSGDGILIQSAQLEQGLISTPYIETGASTAQAGILEDMPRLDYSGGATCGSLLLEPQRSNVLTNSEYGFSNTNSTLTYNNTTSPEGLQNAFKLTENTATGQHRADINFNAVVDTYTFSVFAKAGERNYINFAGSNVGAFSSTFNLSTGEFEGINGGTGSIEDYGNGWYRLIVTKSISSSGGVAVRIGTATSSTIQAIGSTESYTGDGVSGFYLYGYMVERGSYATSYIPTYGASVTRGVDDAVATHTISDTETLTYYTEFIAPEQTSGGGEHLLENSSGSSRIRIYQNNSTSIRIRTDSPSANFDYSYSSLGIDVGDTVKVALSVDSGVMTAFINGVKKNTFSSATINFARLHLRPQTIITYNTGIIFNSALSDDECIQLTTI